MTKQEEYFKKIYCKDGLPKKEEKYLTDEGVCVFRKHPEAWTIYQSGGEEGLPEWWLKPIPSQPVKFEEWWEKNCIQHGVLISLGTDCEPLMRQAYEAGCNQPPLEGGVFNAEKFLDGINCCTITEDAADVKENYYYNYKDLVKELIKLQSPKPVEPKELMKKFFEWDAANKFTSTQKDIWEWFLPYLNKPVEGDVRAEAIKIADKSVGSYSNSLTKSIATAVVDALLSKYNITRKG